MSERVTTALAALRRRFESIYRDRLVRLVLFGSHARGDAEPGSDLDVLVVLRGPVQAGTEIERTGDAVAEVSLDTDLVIGCVFVSADRYRSEWSPLLANVRREGVTV